MNNQELEKRNKILERRWKIALLIAVLFVVTRPVALYVVNHLIHKAAIDAVTNKFPLIDPARQVITSDNYIINIQPLRTYLNNLATQIGDKNVSIYYEQLNSGANISVNKNNRFFPASLVKVPLAILAVKKVENGSWKWDTEFSAAPADLDSGSGDLYKTIGNNKITVEKLLEALLINSDNTAYHMLSKGIGADDYVALQNEIGLEDVYNEQGMVSAKEYSRILRTLYTASFLSPDGSEKILDLMSQSTFHDFLSQGLPSDVKFSHKYGENTEQSIFADSGIVYQDGHPFMITVILKGKDSTPATRTWAMGIMKDIAAKAIEMGKEKVGYK